MILKLSFGTHNYFWVWNYYFWRINNIISFLWINKIFKCIFGFTFCNFFQLLFNSKLPHNMQSSIVILWIQLNWPGMTSNQMIATYGSSNRWFAKLSRISFSSIWFVKTPTDSSETLGSNGLGNAWLQIRYIKFLVLATVNKGIFVHLNDVAQRCVNYFSNKRDFSWW